MPPTRPTLTRTFAGAALVAAALALPACSSQGSSADEQSSTSASPSPESSSSTSPSADAGPSLAPATGRVTPMRQFPTSQLKTATGAVSPSASPQDGQQSQSSSRTGKATIRQVDTTVGGATETGADLIVGQIVPAPTGFAGENFVQDGCSGSTSNNPILVTNNTSTTQSFGYNAQSQLQSSGSLLMLSTPPYLESGATETNMCTLLYQQGWVINTGDEMTVEPGMTGVVYALMGGGAQTGGEAAWLVMGGTGAGWYQFELQLKSPTQGFDFLEMPGNDGSQGAMGNWIENGPVGANLVACGTNPGGGAYPDESSIIVNGDVPGDWASPGQNYNSGEGPEYTFNQPICFAAPDGT